MQYLLVQQAAKKWGISKRRVQILCSQGRVHGATLTGHAWMIPENAEKPLDARIHFKKASHTGLSVQKVRGIIKKMSLSLYDGLRDQGVGISEAKEAAIVLLASKLLHALLRSPDGHQTLDLALEIQKHFDLPDILSQIDLRRLPPIEDTMMRVAPFSDDVLSWTYQYINKKDPGNELSATQFFTERYMISDIVDHLSLSDPGDTVVDPACGGGNFLLYAFEKLCQKGLNTADDNFFRERLNRIYGYELDKDLAVVASINLRLKVIQLMGKAGLRPGIRSFFDFSPKIYASLGKTGQGALDPHPERHHVRQIGSNMVTTLDQVLQNKKYMITNPPFQTVKGMAGHQKVFLKQEYPLAKCDMCNAFLQRCLESVAPGGTCGLVTQTSWMYLDSFEELREWLLDFCTVERIVELGADSFIDLSGEKANVALVICRRQPPRQDSTIEFLALSAFRREACINMLNAALRPASCSTSTPQANIRVAPKHRFSLANADNLQNILNQSDIYRNYAVPMQGTSTGNAKRLVDYYWKHLGDRDWVPVSKGGGYARWQGLNHYCVKWGVNGEYIKQTPGSALRNTSYFTQTQLVFSDTGTAGLNIRILRNGQIFIASGPGIRVVEGLPMAHLAFLNSKLATYFIRLLSPKLTIAAGYIGQLPAGREILLSEELAQLGQQCVSLKARRLFRHPCHMEFTPVELSGTPTTIEAEAMGWFRDDLASQRNQLLLERKIDQFLAERMGLAKEDIEAVAKSVGPDLFSLPGAPGQEMNLLKLDQKTASLLTESCELNRTRPAKSFRGCDCLLEYLSLEIGISCESLYRIFIAKTGDFTEVLQKYRDAFLHALVLSTIGFRPDEPLPRLEMSLAEFRDRLLTRYPGLGSSVEDICQWLQSGFSSFHEKAFWGAPVFSYHETSRMIIMIEG